MISQRNGNDAGTDLRRLRGTVDHYLSGRSGIRYEMLAQFADPLFDLYELDWRNIDGSGEDRDRDELTTMVAVLDTARLLWSFFSLDEEANIQMLPELEDALVGRQAGDEERSNVLVLLSILEEHWRQFSPTERAYAEDTPGFTLPSFEILIAEYTNRTDSIPTEWKKQFGLEQMDLPDALALFAQPLIDDPGLDENPEVLETRIARAQAYWDLATTPPDDYERELSRIVEEFADNQNQRKAIRVEARRMVARYRELFIERPDGEL